MNLVAIFAKFWWVILFLIPFYGFCYLTYFLIGLPLRRQERARFFIDLIDTGLQQGRSVEETIVSISETRDDSVGVRFHLVATYLRAGWDFVAALEMVPSLLSPQLIAMLKAGREIGDLKKIMPACRTLLRDGAAQIQCVYHYVVVLAFVLIPITPGLFCAMTVFVFPRLQALFADFAEDGGVPPDFSWMYVGTALAQLQLVLALIFYIGAIFYLGGARLVAWLQAGLSLPFLDAFLFIIPWRRKRLQRDFSAMLAVLLDAGVAEERAVLLAAESTANHTFLGRARLVTARLRQGVALPEALRSLDPAQEFHWRLSNALHARQDFFRALSGWIESLDARAFRQEQTTAQIVTTLLVVVNGVMVGLTAISIFAGITSILEAGVLW